ncbi:unnamed protein product [Adineta steineri]|uniref:TIR domain-containing protein n=1 Tax=Adineta steineri TaxID=433720 RepID=A0A814RGX7_9BILA|nr:unnamed protein product [Adineta steineri]
MAETISDSPDNKLSMSENNESSNLHEFREMVDVALNLDMSSHTINDDISVDEQNIDEALLSDTCEEQINGSNTVTSVTVSELPSGITDCLNVAAKQLHFLYDSVVSTPSTENGEEVDENRTETAEEISNGVVEQCTEDEETDHYESSSTISKTTTHTTTTSNQPHKRHIMISYNRSSRQTCQRIYDGLVAQNYKVWMDLTDMADDILVSMARAVENSYIVLLCISQKYYESDYCRLEAEYAAENRIKFIPCLMEKSFRAQSWLGIIKGSNVHIDFSESEDFDQSFNELIRQITYVERKLSLQPRRTPAPGPMINPMKLLSMPPQPSVASTFTNDVNSRRFDAIIREYKQSIKKKRHHLTRLKRSELSDLILKIRQELFTETSQVLSDGERSDEEDEKQNNNNNNNNEQYLQQLVTRSLDQNELLLKLVDRLTTPQPMEQNNSQNLNMDGIIKVIIAIMLLWTLNIICHKKE